MRRDLQRNINVQDSLRLWAPICLWVEHADKTLLHLEKRVAEELVCNNRKPSRFLGTEE